MEKVEEILRSPESLKGFLSSGERSRYTLVYKLFNKHKKYIKNIECKPIVEQLVQHGIADLFADGYI